MAYTNIDPAAYTRRPTRWHVSPAGTPTYSELATEIRFDDEGTGEYIVLAQGRRSTGEIEIKPEEWPALSDAISHAISQCLCSETQPARSHVTSPERLREIAQLMDHTAMRLDALAERISAASGGLVPEGGTAQDAGAAFWTQRHRPIPCRRSSWTASASASMPGSGCRRMSGTYAGTAANRKSRYRHGPANMPASACSSHGRPGALRWGWRPAMTEQRQRTLWDDGFACGIACSLEPTAQRTAGSKSTAGRMSWTSAVGRVSPKPTSCGRWAAWPVAHKSGSRGCGLRMQCSHRSSGGIPEFHTSR